MNRDITSALVVMLFMFGLPAFLVFQLFRPNGRRTEMVADSTTGRAPAVATELPTGKSEVQKERRLFLTILCVANLAAVASGLLAELLRDPSQAGCMPEAAWCPLSSSVQVAFSAFVYSFMLQFASVGIGLMFAVSRKDRVFLVGSFAGAVIVITEFAIMVAYKSFIWRRLAENVCDVCFS